VISHYPYLPFRNGYIKFKFARLVAFEDIGLNGLFPIDGELSIFGAANNLVASNANNALYKKLLSRVWKYSNKN